ncbi:NUDIX hydrolase [Xenorhabdus sp. PR6a]|uniref:NUDIX domain-containing protein n=1 Tax=Xenorhabdus sp. PR6a TaxID=3025877 RepID=UPI002358EA64|nr:NUDIX hydrolase [Xenorhabdus sp. PR6a]MDC9582843.1 NUDIX hydrolase [Xenorhabdus sp. PR6a]
MIERLVPQEILDSFGSYDRIVVGGIIKVENKSDVLFLKRSEHEFMPDTWEIPSGGIEEEESMLQALKREIKEEADLDVVEIEKYVSSVSYPAKGSKCLQLNFSIRCTGNVKLSAEHSDFIFSSIEAFKGNLDDFMLRVLNLA